MKTRSVPVVLLALIAVFVGSGGETRASGGGGQASCQIPKPAGAPISMNIMVTNVDPSAGNIGSVSVDAFFSNKLVGTFTATNVRITTTGEAVQGACDIFNGTSLGSQIFAAVGFKNSNFMTFTACSVLGPGSAVPDPCKSAVGNINTPTGWATVVVGDTISGQITGYAARL